MAKSEALVDVDDSRYRTTPFQQAAASCTGAVITSLFVTPLDVVKIRLQAQQKAMARSKCFLYCNGLMDHLCGCGPTEIQKQWFHRPGHFNGTIDAFLKISRNEGVTSLWSGLSPTLILAIPATIAYFVTYEQLRLSIKDYYNKNRREGDPFIQPFWVPLVSGATARVISVTAVSPLELIRTKMQSTRLSYLEIGEALKILVKQDGYLGLWKGIFPTLLRDVPFSALYWSQYEALKRFYGPGVPSFSFSFMAGAIAGGVASIVTLPFDVVKTHQQIELGEHTIYGDTPKKTPTTWQIIRRIHTQYGIKGLFIGIVPRVIKVAPACAMMIATFEHGKIAFNRLANYSSSTSSNDIGDGNFDGTNISLSSNSLPGIYKSKDVVNVASKGLIGDINVTSNQTDTLVEIEIEENEESILHPISNTPLKSTPPPLNPVQE